MADAQPGTNRQATQRRPFRFSLQTAAALATVFTVWIGLKANQANRQEYAARTITRHGGQILYDYQVSEGRTGALGLASFDLEAGALGPDWLRGLMSRHYFITPLSLHIRDRRLIDQGRLEALGDLTDLQSLSLGRMRLEAADLNELPPLRNLREFSLEPSYIARENGLEDFEFLAGFPKLRVLRLEFSSFGDDDVRHLQHARELRVMGVRDTLLGDAGLRRLRHMTELKTLNLANTRVTDQGMACLRSFRRLRSLNLSGTAITDAALAELRSLKNLQSLSLVNTAIGDDGLKHLLGMSGLARLELIETRVSDAGAARLHAALGNCRIQLHWDRWIK